MGQGELQAADDTRDRLIQTARAFVLRGDNNFSIATLCGEAQVDRNLFRLYFSGKTALMAALMHEQDSAPIAAAAQPQAERQPEPQPEPQLEPQHGPQLELQTPKVVQEPSVPTPDAWLERRLRVFERALTALESKAEETARDQARVIARLEEKLSVLGSAPAEPRLAPRPVMPVARAKADEEAADIPEAPAEEKPVEEKPSFGRQPVMLRAALRTVAPKPAPVEPVALAPEQVSSAPATEVPATQMSGARLRTAHWSDAAPIAQAETLENVRLPSDLTPEEDEKEEAVERPAAEVLAIAPPPAPSISKQEMADVLESARARARAAAIVASDEDEPKDANRRLRWLAIGAISLVALFLCIGLTLGHSAVAIRKDRMADWHGGGVSHAHAAQGALAQTIASADFGDAKAEARLALAFLRGQGVARDASAALRWSQAAAQAGEPAAQYLLGALYQQGEAVKADPARAFSWFTSAADKGNLKAMHNLAIAYAEGVGTSKDEAKAVQWFTKAAERGYVDSAFDLAVMYERGAGVPQDLVQALKWYGIAAAAGDKPSKARADFLSGQMSPDDAKRAHAATMAFAPLPALPEANTL